MRKPRLKLQNCTAVYHCLSRTVGGQLLLQEPDQEQFRILTRRQARFCGLQIITHSVMSNHFHIILRVPKPRELSDAELLGRAEKFYPAEHPLVGRLRHAMKEQGSLSEALREQLLRRMGDVSAFMKELKQGFSRWYNQKHERMGTLWAERFKSVLVEDSLAAVGTVAVYVDLNAVRAGLVKDPKDYRFCGYGEAVGGQVEAQEGLLSILGMKDWEQGAREYRQRLFVAGAQAGKSEQAVLGRKEILKVLREGGRIGCAEAMQLRIRYFADGVALGTEGWVNEVFGQFRDRFGARRKTGARKLRGLPFEGLRTLRDLRVDVVS